MKKLALLTAGFFICGLLRAQVEAAQLLTKNYSATGLGLNLHIGFPVSKGSEMSGEIGLYYFVPNGYHVLLMPILAGYRYNFNGTRTGLYLEPQAGYSFGGTDIHKTDAGGNLIYQGNEVVDQKASGMTGALALGYLFPKAPLNIGIRYTQVFVSGDPSQSVLALRVSYVVAYGRR